MGKKFKESINSRISSKKYWRTFEQQSYRDELARNLKEKRKEWDKEGMNRLLDEKISASDAGKYIKSIQTLHGRKPTNALAKKIIQEWWALIVLENLDAFSWLDKEIWIKLACTAYDDSNRWLKVRYSYHNVAVWIEDVLKNIDKFQWLDVNVLIDEYVKRSKEYLKIYDFNEMGNKWKKHLSVWIHHYKWSEINKETAKMLILNWASNCITDYIDKFEWLDKEIANLLTAEGHWKFVKAHSEKFWLKKKKKWIKQYSDI